MDQDHITSLKVQEREYEEIVHNNIKTSYKEHYKKPFNNFLIHQASSRERTQKFIKKKAVEEDCLVQQAETIAELQNKMKELQRKEVKLKLSVKKQTEFIEDINRLITNVNNEIKTHRTKTMHSMNLLKKYMNVLKLLMEVENLQQNVYTLNIYFEGNKEQSIKLVLDLDNKSIVSADLNNLCDSKEKSELIQHVKENKKCVPFLLKLRNCIEKKPTQS